MKAAIARQIAGARDRAKHWGRLGARVRWGTKRNTTQQTNGPAGPKGECAGTVQPARGGLVFRARQQELESTREAVQKLEAQFPHLRVQITEEEEETVC
jgi:hypothetical protein